MPQYVNSNMYTTIRIRNACDVVVMLRDNNASSFQVKATLFSI